MFEIADAIERPDAAATGRANQSKGRVEMAGLTSQSGLPSAGLDFLDRTTVHLGSRTYRWLDLERFSLAVQLSDNDALRALLKHERYQDHYATDEANWTPTGDLHGPYRLGAIGVEAFEAVSPSDVRQTLHRWASEWDGATAEGHASVLAASGSALPDGAPTFRLIDLGESAQHDFGWVLGDFHEFVVIDRSVNTLTLVVASDD